jgi:fluoride exporter
LSQILLVAAGGGLGAVARFSLNGWMTRSFGAAFPWHTLTANVVGSVLLGVLFALSGRFNLSQDLRLFFGTGLLGGFTTFSAFSLDVMQLIQRGAVLAAATYIMASLALSLLGVYLGYRWLS